MSNLVEVETEAMKKLVIKGDLSGLNDQEKLKYFFQLCESLELNPTTQPFSYIKMKDKEILYANKSCTEQLRVKKNISLTILERKKVGDLYMAIAKATLPDGRSDESIGVVSTKGQHAEDLANSLMKAETKAKRRVTLSICGLGTLDESELDTMRGVQQKSFTATNVTPKQIEAQPVPVEESNGEYKIEVKKFYGQTLEEVGEKDLKGYLDYCDNNDYKAASIGRLRTAFDKKYGKNQAVDSIINDYQEPKFDPDEEVPF